MKKTQLIKFLTLVLIGFVLLGTYSCKDEYTEEDALKSQQEVDLTIYVVNRAASFAPIKDAKVVVSQGGLTFEGTTNDKGVVSFPKIKVGGFAYSVIAEGFTSANGINQSSPSNYRQGQLTQQVSLYALAGEHLATIQGKAIVEKDLTNLISEPAAGVKVYADVSLYNETSGNFIHTVSATTDANGNYSLTVPTNGNNNSTYVAVRFTDFETEQTIAINKYADEEGEFTSIPQVLPRVEKIKTLFSVSTSSQLNRWYTGSSSSSANGMRSLYAIAEAPPTGGTQAIIDQVYTNSKGEVTGLHFYNGGNYSGDADGKVSVTIVSLDGGSGASVEIPLSGTITTTSALTAYNNNSSTIVKGSGYPINSENHTLNKTSLRSPSGASSLNVYPATIHIANADFGTGIARPKQIVR
jgi:hypothetical protein